MLESMATGCGCGQRPPSAGTVTAEASGRRGRGASGVAGDEPGEDLRGSHLEVDTLDVVPLETTWTPLVGQVHVLDVDGEDLVRPGRALV